MSTRMARGDSELLVGVRANMGKLWPAGQIRPAGSYRNLNSHHELSRRPFFPLETTDGSDE